MATEYFAWCNIMNGGDVIEVPVPSVKGLTKTVITNRNIIETGSKITKAKSGLSDEDWDRMLANGAIRTYPLPEGTDDRTSPSTAFLRQVLDERGNVDVAKMMDMGFVTAPAGSVVAEGEEAKELEAPAGV